MSNNNDVLKLVYDRIPCLEGVSQDELIELVNCLKVEVKRDELDSFVLSTKGVEVKFRFGGDGSFLGADAKMNNTFVPLLHGVNSGRLYLFKGPPTNTNPGAGWQLESDLTRKYLNQPVSESNWEVFFASRKNEIN